MVETVLVYCRNLVWELAVWGVRTNGREKGLIGSIRENYFREMLVEGQSAKYLRLENIALYGITIGTILPLFFDFRQLPFP